MCEVFGAMGEDMPVENLYREALDQFAKGINFAVPHGTWYDGEKNVIFPPELSFRSKKFGPVLPGYNDYIKKASSLLRGGRHICDIAVLYPIADLAAHHKFGGGDPYLGGDIAAYVNYTAIGEALSLELRKDFTYLHPEVLNERCAAENGRLVLNNANNREEYSAVILPAMEAVHAKNLEILREFVLCGGTLISLGRLPDKSAEFGQDGRVREIVAELFGPESKSCRHLPFFTPDGLSRILRDTDIIFDVECPPFKTTGGNFTYIHKITDGRDIYFFANSSDTKISAAVKLRGRKTLEAWDPHAGKRTEVRYSENADVTAVLLELDPVKSIFYISVK
jgi:hypothetical protein